MDTYQALVLEKIKKVSEENKKATEDDWNNAIHKLMNYINGTIL